MKANRKILVGSMLFCFAVLLFVFRKLVLNPSTHLVDFRDYPFCIWTIYQNIGHFKSLDFGNLFESNILYPFKSTLLFSELFLPISIIGLLLSYFITNPILVFNLLFFLTLLLDVVAVHIFWRRVFNTHFSVFFASLVTVISPFFFQNSPHFQSLSFWPFFLALSFLFKPERTRRDAVIAGLFLTLQFLSNTYLGIFSLIVVSLWLLLDLISRLKTQDDVGLVVSHFIHTFMAFGLTCGFFIWKYMAIKQAYHITREYGEYVSGSTQLSDWFFTTHYNSVVSRLPLIARWNLLNVHGSHFPSVTVVILALMGSLSYLRVKARSLLGFEFTKERVFFLLLILGGFIASLGPRLTINNVYIGIPLPYAAVMKLVPFLMSVRVTGRWAFFVFVGLAYFAALGLSKIKLKWRPVVVGLAVGIYLAEVMPLTMPIETRDYYPAVYSVIAPLCEKSPQVMLEYPFEQNIGFGANVLTNLTYRTQYMLASLKHKCVLVDGYSGYLPDDFYRYQNEIWTAISQSDRSEFFLLLKQRDVKILKFNKRQLFPKYAKLIESWLLRSNQVTVLVNDENYLVVELGL